MLTLIEREPSKAAFARKVGTDPAYISQILSTKTKAEVGNDLARAIERAYSLKHGWMDAVPVRPETSQDAQAITDFAWVYTHSDPAGKAMLSTFIDAIRSGHCRDADDKQA